MAHTAREQISETLTLAKPADDRENTCAIARSEEKRRAKEIAREHAR